MVSKIVLNSKPTIMHQSFVTTALPPTRNSGDNNFSSITALLKALYCGDLLRVVALLFIRVNSTGNNITSPSLTRYCGGTQKVIAPHIRWGGVTGVTNDWFIRAPLMSKVGGSVLGKNQLISKSQNYDVFDRVWVCVLVCPKYCPINFV